MITEKIGIPAMLENTAEECAELSKVCLKLARIQRGENPTPANKIEVMDAIEEECADVLIFIEEIIRAEIINRRLMELRMNKKLERARERLCTNN